MEKQESIKRPDDNIWKIALTLVCIVILGYGFLYSKNTTCNIAFLAGFNLPLALIIWAIFYATVARKRGVKIAGVSFIVIFTSMIGSSLIGYSQQMQEAKHAISDIQNVYSKMIESSSDSQGMPKRIEKPINTTPKARGEFGEFEKYIKDVLNQMASQKNDYLLELEAIGWNSILEPQRIRVDKGFVESKVTIKKAKDIVAKYREKYNVLLYNARGKIESLDMSASMKREAIAGFDHGMGKSNAIVDSMWMLEEKIVLEFENIINLLSATNADWVVQESQILFYNDTDLKKFNSYIASIQDMANKQQQIQKQSVETVNSNFTRILKDIE